MVLLSLKKTACTKRKLKATRKKPYLMSKYPVFLRENLPSTIAYIAGIFTEYICSVFLQTQKLCLSWKVV